MGYEYRIRFTVPPELRLDRVLSRLPNAHVPGSEMPLYDFKMEEDGFYFVDYGRSESAALAFRQLVDEGLRNSDQVVIEEL
jgi:hypothetical protein